MSTHEIRRKYDLLIADCTALREKIEPFKPRSALRLSGYPAFLLIPFASPLAITLIMYLVQLIPMLKDYGAEILHLLFFVYMALCLTIFIEYARWGDQEVSDGFYELYLEKAEIHTELKGIMPDKMYIDRYFAEIRLESLIESTKLQKLNTPRKMRVSEARTRYQSMS